MMKKSFTIWALLACVTIFTPDAAALDYWTLSGQSTYRCPGGLVAIGDSDRSVREACGDPLDVTSRDDKGPIWVYHFGQERWMYYLEFVFGKLERILSAPCDRNKFECFDLD